MKASCLQGLGREDEALAVYRQAMAVDRGVFPVILKTITQMPSGWFWLNPQDLKRELTDGGAGD